MTIQSFIEEKLDYLYNVAELSVDATDFANKVENDHEGEILFSSHDIGELEIWFFRTFIGL